MFLPILSITVPKHVALAQLISIPSYKLARRRKAYKLISISMVDTIIYCILYYSPSAKLWLDWKKPLKVNIYRNVFVINIVLQK